MVTHDSNGMKNNSYEIRMIEFFSGIGGMRYGMEKALEFLNTSCQTRYNYHLSLCVAYDISLYANRTYQYNVMPSSSTNSCTTTINTPNNNNSNGDATTITIRTKLIEQLTSQDIEHYQANVWTLSPPCQPFTQRNNNNELRQQRDDALDPRNRALLHICTTLLPSLKENKPRWIFLENVQHFYQSSMYEMWCRTLIQCGYTFVPYLLNPATSLGIPNNRTRFYMICELVSTRHNRFPQEQQLCTTFIPYCCSSLPNESGIIQETLSPSGANRKPLSHYLELNLTEEDVAPYLLTPSQLQQRWSTHLSVVTPTDDITYCFTAGYSRILHKSTGSVLLSCSTTTSDCIDKTNLLQYLGKIRRFTPKELCNLFGFPKSFQFPKDDIPLSHQYKLIGNSIHVTLVAKLLEKLLVSALDSDIHLIKQR